MRKKIHTLQEIVKLSLQGQDCAIEGVLTFATVLQVRQQGEQLIAENPAMTFDLSRLTASDSAGLAVLIDWLRFARRQSKEIAFKNLPAQLRAIADVTGVTRLLPIVA